MLMERAEAVRGEVRRSDHRRLSHGLYLPLGAASARDEVFRDLRAWRLVLPPDSVFTHVTAAYLRGWWLPQLPPSSPVFAAAGRVSNRPRRAGLICSRLERDAPPTDTAQGLPVDLATEVLLRSARDLALLDLVPMVDSALRCGDVSITDLGKICETTRPGVRQLRRAVSMADARAESPWETLLRLFHVAVGIEVVPQANLYDAAGRWVARADLWVPGTPYLHEYDGRHHDRTSQRAPDLRRLRLLADSLYVRRGYVADDLLNHPAPMLQEMDRELGREHRPGRLATWRRWVMESTYSEAGRRRLQNRWLRRTTPIDWSQTA